MAISRAKGACGTLIVTVGGLLTARPCRTVRASGTVYCHMYHPGVDFALSVPRTDAPSHTPENVARYFKQGMENMPRELGRRRHHVSEDPGDGVEGEVSGIRGNTDSANREGRGRRCVDSGDGSMGASHSPSRKPEMRLCTRTSPSRKTTRRTCEASPSCCCAICSRCLACCREAQGAPKDRDVQA